MTSVNIEKQILEDLIDFKLNYISQEIEKILGRWKYKEIESFLKDARTGELKEAEMDAIAMRQLMKTRESLEKIKNDWTNK